MDFNNTNIIFLEKGDFDGDGLLKKAKRWFIMVQASYCGWCTKAKPEFIKAHSDIGDKIVFATIHIDNDDKNTAALGADLRHIFGTDVNGIPAFFSYDAESRKSVKYTGNNTSQDFVKFLTR
jgi:thiol-disulfide isomerase/thioredoxin